MLPKSFELHCISTQLQNQGEALYVIRSLSAVWNHHEVMYGINPKINTHRRVMPYAYGDDIPTSGGIPYQSFGLDRKKTVITVFFLGADYGARTRHLNLGKVALYRMS